MEQQKAGQYYLVEKIAQGGMAEIYKGLAYDTAGLKKTVCIKKILPHIAASREFIDMLVDEAKIAVQLGHGNIAQIYDLGKAGDDYFIVMEYVDGQNLSKIHKKVLRQGRVVPLPLVCFILAEIANGLNYMHRKAGEDGRPLGVIHRDISPQNIVISYSGTVKIIDFGIAHAAVKTGHTESGILKGKFAYMAPEQARGDRIDHRSDIFSLGVIFHELLTGKRLFKGANNKETLRNVRRAKVPPPSGINPDMPGEIDAIALKALAKDRRLRYAFASDFADALLQFLHKNFHDFHPAQLADFMRILFRDEMALNRALSEAEGSTPHLILDKTRTSAETGEKDEEKTSGGAEINWREFMLEAEWPEEMRDSEESPVMHKEAEEKTSALSFNKQAALWSLAMFAVLAAGVGGYFGWQRYKINDQRLSTDNLKPEMLILKPLEPATDDHRLSTVFVESTPPGAAIYMDDKETGLATPAEMKNLKPDEKHVLGLYLGDFKFFKTGFETKGGETQRFHIQLAPDYGSLKIVSQPEGAKVLLDGDPAGLTPFAKGDLAPGRILKIQISAEGFAPYSAELLIAAGKEQFVNAVLERLPSLPPPPAKPIIEQNGETTDRRPETTD